MNSLSFGLIAEVFLCYWLLRNSFALLFLSWQFLSLYFVYIMSLAYGLQVFAEKSTEMGIPLYVMCHFFLATFKVFSLSLVFDNLLILHLGQVFLGFNLFWDLWDSCTWMPKIWELSSHCFFLNKVFTHFSLSSPWDSYNVYFIWWCPLSHIRLFSVL